MPKVFTSKSQKTGQMGEMLATMYLENHGFRIISRNYTRKWGEIDIITEKDDKLHFIEVKSVSRERKQSSMYENYRPEENMHQLKLVRIYRTIQSYLMDKEIPDSVEWQLDLVCVYLDPVNRRAKIKKIENLIG